jgi:hypothetical protein
MLAFGSALFPLSICNIMTLKLKLQLQSNKPKQTPWPEPASELHRSRDRRLSAKLVPTFANRGSHVVSVTDPYGRILGFLDRNYNQFKIQILNLK